MAANPQHANTLGNYAYFLQHVRRDMAGAAELYKAAVDLAPAHESSLVNWVPDIYIHIYIDRYIRRLPGLQDGVDSLLVPERSESAG